MIVFALVLHKALSLSRGITTLFAGGLLTFAIGAGATLAWTVAKDCATLGRLDRLERKNGKC